MNDVTQCVNGQRPDVWPSVYVELRRLGSAVLRGESSLPADGDLTAIVHEAWAKLRQSPPGSGWQSRAHFFGSASRAMRQSLIDQARRRNATKRLHTRAAQLDPDSIPAAAGDPADRFHRIIEIDAALHDLALHERDWADVAEMKLFGNLPMWMIAERLGISRRTAERHWDHASRWLRERLCKELS